jgi:hypothetical protein
VNADEALDQVRALLVGMQLETDGIDFLDKVIERVREEHQPREEVLYYQNDEPVRGTICSVCVYTGDDEDPAGNRFRYREHADWPCPTIQALDDPS